MMTGLAAAPASQTQPRRAKAKPAARAVLRVLPGGPVPGRPSRPRAAAPVGSHGSEPSALAAYLKQLRHYPLLDREEEHEIAVHFAATGDPAAARRLVTANLRLVVKLAGEYRDVHNNLLDLIQEGNVGLIHAIRKYDPTRGVKVSSYAAWWIRAYMLKFILANWRIVKLGTTQAQRRLFFNLRKQRERLERNGIAAPASAVAAALGVRESEVVEMDSRMGASDASLDAPSASGGGDAAPRLPRAVAPESSRPDVKFEETELQVVIRRLLERFNTDLPDRERYVLQSRLWCDEPKTLDEVGERFGVSRERARQIEVRLKSRLRAYMITHLGPASCGVSSES